jgi:hypothetical protein
MVRKQCKRCAPLEAGFGACMCLMSGSSLTCQLRRLCIVGRCVDPGCSKCDAATLKKCTQCFYQLESGIWQYGKPAKDGRCKGCRVRGCEQCRPNGTCARCQYGYVMKDGKCVI